MRVEMRRTFSILQWLLWALPLQAGAAPFFLDTFGAGAGVESFEGLERPNSIVASVNLPTPFTFPSGLELTKPSPNNNNSFGPFIVAAAPFDPTATSLTGGFYGYTIASDPTKVPDGGAYLGQASPSALDNTLEFRFDRPVRKVGMYLAVATPTAPAASATIKVYNAANVLLETLTSVGVTVDGWSSNFVGIQRSEVIDRMEITGIGTGVLRVDVIKWEEVPEPGTGLLCFAFLAATRSIRRRTESC